MLSRFLWTNDLKWATLKDLAPQETLSDQNAHKSSSCSRCLALESSLFSLLQVAEMRRRLPPFAALRAFEAAARHSSFKLAAEDICLSASAISHQVRALEEYLGVNLFYREKGKPTLTDAGADYLERIADIFDQLDLATNDISGRGKRRSLVINLFPSMISCWLLKRLPVFKAANPDVDIKLLGSIVPLEFSSGDIDLAICYGKDDWAGLRSNFLFKDELFLICNPQMVDDLPPLDRMNELSEHTLIHCSHHPDEWQQWYAMAGSGELEVKHRIDLDSRALVLEAVASGLGIAIGRTPFVNDYIDSKRICDPYQVRMRTDMGYYLVCPEQHAGYDNVVKFRDWLLAESGCGG
jgi:LysR family glycine cleavage system transcriptional activator